MDSEYTLLPFLNYYTSAKLLIGFAALLLAVILIKSIVFKNALSLHRAPATIAFSYVTCCIINAMMCTFLYWYWALPIALIFSFVFAFTCARDVREANSEERIGVYGLNKDIRRVRGELFNDMSVEEQLAYRANTKETHFSKLIFIAVTMLAAAVAILIFYLLNIGYLFFPVLK